MTTENILNALGCPESELSVLFVDDEEILRLNCQYLQRNATTNVISFPMLEGEFSEITPALLGDVVISVDTALKEAQEAGISLEDRLKQLLVHGILHLLGYDHEKPDSDVESMEKKSNELCRLLNIDEICLTDNHDKES
jgi:probable rRNA maturation factor